MLILLLLFMNFSEPNPLDGKWLAVKNAATYIVPTVPILEFNSQRITLYDFNKEVKTEITAVKPEFRFIDQNRIVGNDDDSIFYVRLLPTATELSDKEIEKLKFEFIWNNEKVKVVFNEELSSPGMTEIFKTKEVEMIRLERIDSTLFISFYTIGKRSQVLPIKKITTDSIEIYGFYKAPFYVTSK